MAGVVAKSVWYDDLAEVLLLSLYLVMGWFGGISAWAIARRHGYAMLGPLFFGALAYTGGAIAEFFRWSVIVPGVVHAHELFHLFVLAGALLQWVFIWRLVSPDIPPGEAGGRNPERS